MVTPDPDRTDPEPAHGLGEASDCHSRQARVGAGEPSYLVRSRRPSAADPEAAQSLGPSAVVFGSPAGSTWRASSPPGNLLLVANGHDTKRAKHGARVD